MSLINNSSTIPSHSLPTFLVTLTDLVVLLSVINMRLIIILLFFHSHSVHSVLKEGLMPRLGELSAEKGADTDQRVLEAYQMQCVAEAQEGQNRIIHVADPHHNDLVTSQLSAFLYVNLHALVYLKSFIFTVPTCACSLKQLAILY